MSAACSYAPRLYSAVAAFERALARDSTYARAWSGLADAYVLFAQYGVPGVSTGEAGYPLRALIAGPLRLVNTMMAMASAIGQMIAQAMTLKGPNGRRQELQP